MDPSLRKGLWRSTLLIITLTPVQVDGQHLKTHFLLRLYEGMVVTGIKSQSCYRVEPTISVPNDGGRSWTPQSVSSCRFLWVSPNIRLNSHLTGRDPWTGAEDLKLLEELALHGKRWNIISGTIKGRPAVQCRNRFLSLQRAGKVSEDGKSSTSTIAARSPTSGTGIIMARAIPRHMKLESLLMRTAEQ